MNTVPLKVPLFISLFLAWAWSIISAAAGLNALVKSNDSEKRLRNRLPSNATINIDSDDILHAGIVSTVVSLLIAVLCTIYLGLLLVKQLNRLFNASLPFQSISLAFCAVWLFAVQIPLTVFFANNEAKVTASFGPIPLTQEIIQSIARSLGVSPAYRDIDYLRLLAIFPWFTILFTSIFAVVSFMASRRRNSRNAPLSQENGKA
ncbi:hypothetical protein Moror_1781 [Moniliophthora roreri MCA 2997]|uniref:Uncharacterized protein n=2 Tax=Moniliophthora roreri TaxID=221103 RepID=V2XLK1_MONRO|nr:hypothetical protein Moror_1781 [Moniliophthora roreri MCA 2997]